MKKIIITTIALFITIIVSGQISKSELRPIFKNDNLDALKKTLTSKNKDTCIDFKDTSYTLLVLSIRMNALKCFDYLLKNKASLEKICSTKTPLMYAAKYGKLNMAKKLIKAGAKLNTESYNGRTAIDYAKKFEKREVYKYLKSL